VHQAHAASVYIVYEDTYIVYEDTYIVVWGVILVYVSAGDTCIKLTPIAYI
jgi:hypothetical protein